MGSEVKGIWFCSLRGYLESTRGSGAWEEFSTHFMEEYREAAAAALPGAWYPEEMLQDQLALMHSRLADGDDPAFVSLIEEVSLSGIGRFFRVLLALGSPRFACKQVPTLWKRLRRGPQSGTVRVEADRSEARLQVRSFPYLADRNYRLLHVGTMRALLRSVGVADPAVEIERAGADFIDLRLRYEPNR